MDPRASCGCQTAAVPAKRGSTIGHRGRITLANFRFSPALRVRSPTVIIVSIASGCNGQGQPSHSMSRLGLPHEQLRIS